MMRAARTAIAGSRGAAGHDARSGGGLIKPLIVYALPSLIAATRRRSAGSGRADPHLDSRRPATEGQLKMEALCGAKFVSCVVERQHRPRSTCSYDFFASIEQAGCKRTLAEETDQFDILRGASGP